MSVDLIVYLRRAAMPSPLVWQQAIHDADFPVELDKEFDIDRFNGFLSCTLRGSESGFELFAARLSEKDQSEFGIPAGSDFSVTLVTHSDLREFACSVAAAGALVQASGGILVDPQSGESFAKEDVLLWAREQFAEAESV